ncbi:MAG: LPXTG cell wall anchor domain-containing protein [Prolixibacteraceae bacterium]|jgi:LPXTG-motif cell wall-anchored protein|nr:LPXTG cell wall anchor domain-containing protein [Prolixibacteraceae bacterium]
MKRFFLLMVLFVSMAIAGMAAGYAQDEELFDDKKDTISIDDMDPVFYEAEEENAKSKSSATAIVIVAGVAVVLTGVYFFMKKKKK